jgi:hypothetical protein
MKKLFLIILLLSVLQQNVWCREKISLKILDTYKGKTITIREGSNIIIDIENKMEIEGKFYFLNDSMIEIDDTIVKLKSIDYLFARPSQNGHALGYVASCALMSFPGIAIYYVVNKFFLPVKQFDVRRRYRMYISKTETIF